MSPLYHHHWRNEVEIEHFSPPTRDPLVIIEIIKAMTSNIYELRTKKPGLNYLNAISLIFKIRQTVFLRLITHYFTRNAK
jgi:hypothetical protein